MISQKVIKRMAQQKALPPSAGLGAQILRNEAYMDVRRNDEGCSAIPQNAGLMDFLRSHLLFLPINQKICTLSIVGRGIAFLLAPFPGSVI